MSAKASAYINISQVLAKILPISATGIWFGWARTRGFSVLLAIQLRPVPGGPVPKKRHYFIDHRGTNAIRYEVFWQRCRVRSLRRPIAMG